MFDIQFKSGLLLKGNEKNLIVSPSNEREIFCVVDKIRRKNFPSKGWFFCCFFFAMRILPNLAAKLTLWVIFLSDRSVFISVALGICSQAYVNRAGHFNFSFRTTVPLPRCFFSSSDHTKLYRRNFVAMNGNWFVQKVHAVHIEMNSKATCWQCWKSDQNVTFQGSETSVLTNNN